MGTEKQRIEAVRKILQQIYRLDDDPADKPKIGRLERETIFWLYEIFRMEKHAEARPHSAAARRLWKNGQVDRSTLTYDHAIPLNMLRPGLKASVRNYASFRKFLRKYVQGVVITRAENAALDKMGLRRTLPAGSEAHDMMARYKAARIKFIGADKRALASRSKRV